MKRFSEELIGTTKVTQFYHVKDGRGHVFTRTETPGKPSQGKLRLATRKQVFDFYKNPKEGHLRYDQALSEAGLG